MNFYANGHKLANQDDIDKKLNVHNSLFDVAHNDGEAMNEFNVPISSQQGLLRAIRIFTPSELFNVQNGIGILFGMDGVSAFLSVAPFANANKARISVSTNNGKSFSWQDDLVFKSDYDKLAERVTALEKQIGGGTK